MVSIFRKSSIKRVEEEILKESKAEEGAVKQVIKDLSRLERETRKARKSAGNADTTLSRREQYEHKTAKDMNDAIHEHDLATVKLRAAEKDAELKHKHYEKLTKELEAKKSVVETAMRSQTEHNQERQTKLAQMRGVAVKEGEPWSPRLPDSNGHDGLPGQSGPSVKNNGQAPGYGLDYNHTAVDSEGNPRDGHAQNGMDHVRNGVPAPNEMAPAPNEMVPGQNEMVPPQNGMVPVTSDFPGHYQV
ncbi:hypothetical protein NP233_g5729 [Leucocoprinus birnbaumii]|uniref:Uncharacterized protein n=1 Tax=Leucocoprinus birnbaumii TaxID=56174 RepID=A0AAD5VTK4_9AGAR|nr:hypothetical protein NP233_g5729 [Leucocoprinus birnbaumii]